MDQHLADHPHTDPGDGRTECDTCGKWVFECIHSCKGVPVTEAAMTRFIARHPDKVPAKKPLLCRHDDRFKVVAEYCRDDTIFGWTVMRNGKALGFWYKHSRAMTVAHRMAQGGVAPESD